MSSDNTEYLKLSAIPQTRAPRQCIKSIIKEIDHTRLSLINETLIYTRRLDHPVESAYEVNCNATDCKSHIYHGKKEICTDKNVRDCVEYLRERI